MIFVLKGITIGEFLSKMQKFFFCCLNWEDSDKYFAKKMEKKLLLILLFKIKRKLWWNSQVQSQTRSLGLSDHGLHCNPEEWSKELKDTS